MPLKFKPKYKITDIILKKLLEIESIKERVQLLPLTPKVLTGLRESSRLFSTHYSTMIEGNRLTQKEVSDVLLKQKKVSGRERDEKEIKGYYKALDEAIKLADNKIYEIKEKDIRILHGYIVGSNKPKPTEYRTEQNVIKEVGSGKIVYLPPEAKDVPELMASFVSWINENKDVIPIPILAAVTHYQFVTIHPYYDGNGRTARILTTLVLHKYGYGLKGIYNLEEYYAKNLQRYYEAVDIGKSHNYYFGRAVEEITSWIEYFIKGMSESFNKIEEHFGKEKTQLDMSDKLRNLDARQKKILTLFDKTDFITSKDIEKLFKFSGRTSRQLAQKYVKSGFLKMEDASKKARKYTLSDNELR
jgi:Fic family protein